MSELYSKIKDSLEKRFCNFQKNFATNFALVSLAILDSSSFSTHQIAASMSKILGINFHSSENRLSRFLSAKNLEIGDKAFRNLINLVFELLEKRSFLYGVEYIPINVDFTSERDNFLILSASIPFFGRSLPIFFTMRDYPKKKNQFSQKKMEQAFFLRLRHLLPKKYKYVIVADRGFGNYRIMKILDKLGFDFLIRVKENLKMKLEIDEIDLSKIPKNERKYIDIKIKSDPDSKLRNLVASFSKDKNLKHGWFLVTNLTFEKLQNITQVYKNRFQIEKTFQDQKSSGFNMEKTKISIYSRFKKLLFCAYISQVLLLFLGEYIDENVDTIKKKFQTVYEKYLSYFSLAVRAIKHYKEEVLFYLLGFLEGFG